MPYALATDEQMEEWTFGFEFEFLVSLRTVLKDSYDTPCSSRIVERDARQALWDLLRDDQCQSSRSIVNDGYLHSIGSDGTVYEADFLWSEFAAIEMRSQPINGNAAFHAMIDFFDVIKRTGRTGNKCGLHVHMSHPVIRPSNTDWYAAAVMHSDLLASRLFPMHGYSSSCGWTCIRGNIANKVKIRHLEPPVTNWRRSQGLSRARVGDRFEVRSPGGADYEHRPKTTWRYLRHVVHALRKAHDRDEAMIKRINRRIDDGKMLHAIERCQRLRAASFRDRNNIRARSSAVRAGVS